MGAAKIPGAAEGDKECAPLPVCGNMQRGVRQCARTVGPRNARAAGATGRQETRGDVSPLDLPRPQLHPCELHDQPLASDPQHRRPLARCALPVERRRVRRRVAYFDERREVVRELAEKPVRVGAGERRTHRLLHEAVTLEEVAGSKHGVTF